MSLLSLILLCLVLLLAIGLLVLVRKLSRSLWQSQVRLARLEQVLAQGAGGAGTKSTHPHE